MFKWLTEHLIKNVRLGFATNSSSSHSLVFYSDQVDLPVTNSSWSEYGFGWEDFTISDLPTKIAYGLVNFNTLAWQESNNHLAVQEHLRETVTDLLVELGVDPEEVFAFFDEEAPTDIDHQSAFNNITNMSREDQLQYLAMLADPNLVIYGGNDNGGLGPRDFFDRPGVTEVRSSSTPFDIEVDLPYGYTLRENEDGFSLIYESWNKEDWTKVEKTLAVGGEAIMAYVSDNPDIFGECNFKLPHERAFPIPVENPTLSAEW